MLSLFFLLLSKSKSVEQILLVSAAVVAATRLASYFEEDLSKDLAKIFPFTVLAIFLLEPDFFKLSIIINRITYVPNLLNHILVYLIFITALEIFIRGVFLIIDFWTSDNEISDEETEEVNMKKEVIKVNS
jgi:hypothetical protein